MFPYIVSLGRGQNLNYQHCLTMVSYATHCIFYARKIILIHGTSAFGCHLCHKDTRSPLDPSILHACRLSLQSFSAGLFYYYHLLTYDCESNHLRRAWAMWQLRYILLLEIADTIMSLVPTSLVSQTSPEQADVELYDWTVSIPGPAAEYRPEQAYSGAPRSRETPMP